MYSLAAAVKSGLTPRRVVRAVAVAGVLGLVCLLDLPVAHAGPLSTTRVIVTADTTTQAGSVVLRELGTVVTSLPIINGVVADVSPLAVIALRLLPGITVTPDLTVNVTDDSTPPRAPADVFPQATGATQLEAGGDSGQGIGVAILDTGISSEPDFAGRLLGGVDLSGEGNPLVDSYGHGTFVAGLIAANGASSGGAYQGEAPGANLISVKVAGASGLTDMATVIDGMQWTVANRSQLGIRVLNLSLGVTPPESTAVDPLDQAVEAVWHAGIVVVASAGNGGPSAGTILSPGDDPLVITVGATDDNGTAATADDTMASFSGVGPTAPDGWIKPDLVTSGRSVVSLRAAGSTIDRDYPSARIGTSDFVGSGTSFSSAITSGAVALILAAHPGVTPDEVKARLLSATTPGPVGNPNVDGHGALDVAAAADAPNPTLEQAAVAAVPTLLGGTVSLVNSWAVSSWNPANWQGWAPSSNGSPWTSLAWNGSNWTSLAWNGSAWNGSAWSSLAWNGSTWNSATWRGAAWNGSSWTSLAWNGSEWGG